MAERYKILDQWLIKSKRTGEFIHFMEVNPQNGGKSTIIRLGFNKAAPFNMLVSENGYHETKDEK